ncbi:MAG: UDP-4-amino-4,6-dideoxy-N-acetyl-beta-L-altrosamine N-acetyltransferase [Planctomycetota bacterium]|nr:UDP-4-amino-4,6-dideoxy-N-acetyl-beta-L-altrosamine N-acetyltransferase [Planctomycetota bacterium]
MLVGKRIRLRAVEEKDLPKIVEWRNKPEIYQYFYEYEPLSNAQQKIWFEKFLKNESEKYFIIETTAGKAIGTVGLTHIDWRNRKCEWGRFLIGEKKHQGKGYGKEAVALILKYVFEHLNMHKLYCDLFASNQKVISLYKSSGFEIEGTLRKHVFKNGDYQDVVMMGMLKEEYIKNRKSILKRIV